MTTLEPAIDSATIEWRQGQPLSIRYRDPYFSRTNGRAETEHVFLHHNDLAARWRALASGAQFAIGETGFGTGLNFLCAAELWLRTAHRGAHLHFVSAEKYPLTKHQLVQALAIWPDLAGLARQLLDAYPPLVPGHHRLRLAGSRVTLTLLFDDATAAFEQLRYSDHPVFARSGPYIDAWFLDGFAPAKNPGLWTEQLFAIIANLSDLGTTFSTFTAAGAVRRALAGTGFRVAKVRGYGDKREMLCGDFAGAGLPPGNSANAVITQRGADPVRSAIASSSIPWYLPCRQIRVERKNAAVIGGGIAGCTTAAALARRGWQVTLHERHSALAGEASGNPQAIIFPRLSLQSSPLARINLAALLYASRFYAPFWARADAKPLCLGERFGKRCGVLILPENPDDETLFPRIAARYGRAPELVRLCAGEQLAAIAGVPLAARSGLHFPSLGWIRPAALCAALVEHPNIRIEQADIAALDWNSSTTRWQLTDRQGHSLADAAVVILANSLEVKRFAQTDHFALKAIRGQISAAPATVTSSQLQTVICGAGYLAPALENFHTLGATYDFKTLVTTVSDADHHANLDRLAATDSALPAMLDYPQIARLSGRAALRCVSPDYLPLIGPAPRQAKFVATYAALRRDARTAIASPGPYWPGLYINCGHGSRGMSYAPLGAELLASQINREVLPLERELVTAMNPARFLIRALKRRQL